MIYLDTSALVKIIRREDASDALSVWLAERPDVPLISSVLAEVELPRALRRSEPSLLKSVPGLLGRLATFEIDEVVRDTAAAYQDPQVRSLDAIHLATADAIIGDQLESFVCYDKQLLKSAVAIGLPAISPGVTY